MAANPCGEYRFAALPLWQQESCQSGNFLFSRSRSPIATQVAIVGVGRFQTIETGNPLRSMLPLWQHPVMTLSEYLKSQG